MAKKKANPIDITVKPLILKLQEFCKDVPPDVKNRPSVHFDKVFKRLDVEFVRVWLDKCFAADTAEQFALRMKSLLIKLRRWENDILAAGVYKNEDWTKLDEIDRGDLQGRYDDIVDYAAETIECLKNIQRMFQERLDSIGLKELQLTILYDLSDNPQIYRTGNDICKATIKTIEKTKPAISRPTIYRWLDGFVKMGLAEKNKTSNGRGGYKITEKGLSYLQILDET
ncbi:MAG: PadR family transcriptional regulator [Planctomycetales bacterium]|nr:PadR family transcriptional regulator [Planctomycetales bacterium]